MINQNYRQELYESADTAMLETDIMRFVAILAICLLVVFALVQSIPVSNSDIQNQIAVTPIEPVKAVENSEMLKVTQQVTDLRAALAKKDAQAKELLTMNHSKLKKLKLLRNELSKAKLAVETKDIQIKEENKRLSKNQEVMISKIKSELKTLRERELSIKKQFYKSKASSKNEHSAIKINENKLPILTLEFVSNEAFFALLKSYRVRLYAFQDKKWWQVTKASRFVTDKVPEDLFSMDKSTVPIAITNSKFNESVSWFVWLPADISEQIKSLVDKSENGRLLINESGKVRFNPMKADV